MKINCELEMEEKRNVLPLMNYHQPFADFEVDGETWKLAISGGCRHIFCTTPEQVTYIVDVGEVLGAMVEAIKERKAG